MELLIMWPVAGALVGYMAAQKKGWSVIAGILGGMLLGALSPLMFCLSAVSSYDAATRTCPACAETVKAEAAVCKHCGRALVPVRQRQTVVRRGMHINMPGK